VVSLGPHSDRAFFAATCLVAGIVVTTLIASPSPGSVQEPEPALAVEVVAPTPSVVPAEPVPEPEPVRVRTCQVDPTSGLVTGAGLAGSVALADTGEVLWEVEAESPVVPASVLKLVTARAALEVLGPDFRFTTRVVEGRQSGEVWLVGGGDPTLTRTTAGDTTYYTDPARLGDLVSRVVEARGDVPASDAFARVGIDSSRYDVFPQWNDTWRPNAAALGFVSPVTALMVDGGRLAPAERLSQRTTDPVSQGTTAFVQTLAEATGFWRSEVVAGVAPAGARVIAQVSSPPLVVLLDQMIRDSDNQIAEAVIREVALALAVTSFDDALRVAFDDSAVGGDVFFADDGSGLSQDNLMTPGFATQFLVDLRQEPDMAVVVGLLPRPGEPGSLLSRFVGFEESWPDVSGKTGSLVGVRSLAGIIDGDDPLAFSLFITGSRVDDQSRDVIDQVVVAFRACGENLAHWVPTETGG
jgi:D-alanyl-D-alanine carboxypeptidase/D-alanyl-D-alanine-endopeptidase (penicillin-binding protein 4)